MLMTDCAFLPPEDGKRAREFLKKNSAALCHYFGTVFNVDQAEVTVLKTQVITRLDQHYSTNCATFNFALTANPTITTSIDADQLRDWLLREFPELKQFSFAVMYLPGITSPSRAYARHL